MSQQMHRWQQNQQLQQQYHQQQQLEQRRYLQQPQQQQQYQEQLLMQSEQRQQPYQQQLQQQFPNNYSPRRPIRAARCIGSDHSVGSHNSNHSQSSAPPERLSAEELLEVSKLMIRGVSAEDAQDEILMRRHQRSTSTSRSFEIPDSQLLPQPPLTAPASYQHISPQHSQNPVHIPPAYGPEQHVAQLMHRAYSDPQMHPHQSQQLHHHHSLMNVTAPVQQPYNISLSHPPPLPSPPRYEQYHHHRPHHHHSDPHSTHRNKSQVMVNPTSANGSMTMNYQATKPVVDEEKAIRIALLVSKQEQLYGKNMYETLTAQDEPELNYLKHQLHMDVDDAILKIFERKGYVVPDTPEEAEAEQIGKGGNAGSEKDDGRKKKRLEKKRSSFLAAIFGAENVMTTHEVGDRRIRYRDADVKKLKKMGFSKDQAVQALLQTDHNVERAAEILLTSGGNDCVDATHH